MRLSGLASNQEQRRPAVESRQSGERALLIVQRSLLLGRFDAGSQASVRSPPDCPLAAYLGRDRGCEPDGGCRAPDATTPRFRPNPTGDADGTRVCCGRRLLAPAAASRWPAPRSRYQDVCGRGALPPSPDRAPWTGACHEAALMRGRIEVPTSYSGRDRGEAMAHYSTAAPRLPTLVFGAKEACERPRTGHGSERLWSGLNARGGEGFAGDRRR